VITVTHIDPRTSTSVPPRQSASRARLRLVGVGLVAGAVAVGISACGGSTPTAAPAQQPVAAVATPRTVNISMIGKIDADKGPVGTFTSKEHWPAMAPSDVTFAKGDNVVLTIKEYDDAPTALPAGSPYNKVTGGTMTVNGVPTTTVSNADIAHTFTIPALGINAPLPKAPEGGYTTIVFTFHIDKAGTYSWRCFTPCGADPKGMGGAMATDGWMRGNVIVT
jgi:hypothetical protein